MPRTRKFCDECHRSLNAERLAENSSVGAVSDELDTGDEFDLARA